MMTDHPGRVSVIIPVHNGERFLAEALNSVYAQDYRPIEVIVVDDGSEDRSARIASSHEGVTVISQQNLGLAAARNTGIAAATGEFIAFLDADDLMLPNKLSEQVGYMRVHPEVGCTLAAWQNFGDDVDEEVPEPVPPPSRPLNVTRPEALVHLRAGGISAVIKRDALDIVGRFDTSFDFAEDLDWLFRLREAPVEAVILPRVTDRKRFHATNMTRDRSAARNGWLRFMKGVAERRHSEGSRS